ncbi:hypothetical protein Ssi02_31810 [Sinosporangium siamense]|uniref:Uncharacterized protein n=1 Tax=Sinosporangium siamense TaxID=1367973 RepID=A0A919RFH7_9ACTN|nr:hypothetical protein Ssi02_31810 [Sinosporangium siamense]
MECDSYPRIIASYEVPYKPPEQPQATKPFGRATSTHRTSRPRSSGDNAAPTGPGRRDYGITE